MKRDIENAMLHEGCNYDSRRIENHDLQVGDIVQIKNNHPCYGRIGMIIGISADRRKSRLHYTVMFSDNESIGVNSICLSFLSRNEHPDETPISDSEPDATSDSQVSEKQE